MSTKTFASIVESIAALTPAERKRFLRELQSQGLQARRRRGPATSSHEVIRLRMEERLKVATIAARTGKSLGAVKGILRRWRRRQQHN